MKRFIAVVFVMLAALGAVIFAVSGKSGGAAESGYLRIHVRANSNSGVDQGVKYKVKDEVVKYLTPYAAQCADKAAAMKIIGGIIPGIEEVCDRVLRENGFIYKSKAGVRAEEFPTRVYGDLTLESGIYDALIIELGEGAGDNWWCVIYPPLCFTSGTADVRYRSAIYDVINKFLKK